ncbi:tyrosine-protein phosphatase [Limosilactobacillus caecicola]|uniref:tyrosine-protein phosphatase n=1 Tax=Limosilactobacillus caecicola TaxID=2941332 RepID=UPI00203FC157|nr:tyrosine-protein phosphatase [Limosilactobacillus caecicola]
MNQHARLVQLDGAMNFRDLGGYRTQEGKTVKWQHIYRADSLSNLSRKDLQRLENLHITVDCDLRSDYEQGMAPDVVPATTKVIDCHVYPDEDDVDRQVRTPQPLQENNYLGLVYQHVILNEHSERMFQRVLAELLVLPEDQALVYHCSAGKDRTGMMSALILSLIGVDDDTIIRDYLLTNELYDFASGRQLPSDTEVGAMVAKMNLTKGDGPVMRAFLDTIQDSWGSTEEFAKQQLGFTDRTIAEFKAKYLTN